MFVHQNPRRLMILTTTCSAWGQKPTNVIPGLKSTGKNSPAARRTRKNQKLLADSAERFKCSDKIFTFKITICRIFLWETIPLTNKTAKFSLLSTLSTPLHIRFRNWKKMFVLDTEEFARGWNQLMEDGSTRIIYWKLVSSVSTLVLLFLSLIEFVDY